MDSKQYQVNQDNSEFWTELCGTSFAQEHGIRNADKESLALFDKAFFDYYPFALDYLNSIEFNNSEVVEIGLGYGTVGEWLAKRSKHYTGVDISKGPVAMLNHRLKQNNLTTNHQAIQANALALPFEDNSKDYIVSIGCLHHTGDLSSALKETIRVCRPGGKILIMIYHKHSLRSLAAPLIYFACRLANVFNVGPKIPHHYDEFLRWQRDSRLDGSPPPATEFSSFHSIDNIMPNCKIIKKGLHNLGKFKIPLTSIKCRPFFLGWLDRIVGLDIYFIAQKN